jgi:hypothetical protein
MTDSDNDKPARRRGWARVKQLTTENQVETSKLTAELLASLGRSPTPVDIIAAETLAASAIRARRLRSVGKNDGEERARIIQLIRATGMRPAPAAAPAPMTIAQRLAAAGYAPPPENGPSSDFDDADDAEERGDEAALSEAPSTSADVLS